MARPTREGDPWDAALAELLAADGAASAPTPRTDDERLPGGPDVVGGWLLGRDPATLPPRLPLRQTLVLAGAWFVLLPLVVAAPADGDRPTWAWVALGLGVFGVLTTLAALVGRWRSAPLWSGAGALLMLVSGVAAEADPGPLVATGVLVVLSGWARVTGRQQARRRRG